MKRLIIIGLICVMLFAMLAMVSPASAAGAGSVSNRPVGDPPGWSQVNPGEGGSHGPGDGPGNPSGY